MVIFIHSSMTNLARYLTMKLIMEEYSNNFNFLSRWFNQRVKTHKDYTKDRNWFLYKLNMYQPMVMDKFICWLLILIHLLLC